MKEQFNVSPSYTKLPPFHIVYKILIKKKTAKHLRSIEKKTTTQNIRNEFIRLTSLC